MGDELGSASDVDRILGSSTLLHQFLPAVDREQRFLEPSYRFHVKMSGRKGAFEFFLYPGKIKEDSKNVWTRVSGFSHKAKLRRPDK